MAEAHYLNGQWVAPGDLRISVMDLAVLRGFGVFDYLRTYGTEPFMLDEHLARFENSAKVLDLTIPASHSELRTIITDGIKRNGYQDTGIRMVLSGGISEDSVTPGTPTLIIIFQPAARFAAKLYEHGVKVITFPTPRHFPEAKSLNYLTAILAMQKGHKAGAIEAIYVDSEMTGRNTKLIYEGTRTNFFAVRDSRLITPENDILKGITRQAVLGLANELGLETEERPLEVAEIDDFDEVFITSSDKEIMPVVTIDERTIGDGTPGPITSQLMTAFAQLTRG